MTPNTILRASLDVCFGHARSRCAAMAMNERRRRVGHVASKVNYLWHQRTNIINSGIRYYTFHSSSSGLKFFAMSQ